MKLVANTFQCLLPLANTPLIEYTLEFLSTAGVSDVYVVCSSYAEVVENYILKSKWSLASSPFSIHVLKSPESQSVGDALRDIDALGFIEHDFLLISGDIVSNFDFKSVFQAHKDRKTKDKNSIMTMVLREASVSHRTRAKSGAGLFVLDEPTSRCVRYEPAPRPNKNGYINLDVEILSELETVSFRNDLIDCHIDICTPDIPALFTENFDYNSIRTDFVKGILTSDILGKTIYTHILEKNYSARVESYQTYDAVSKDVISRYSYPVVPERNIMEDQTYSYQMGHIYKEEGVVLAQSCIIESGTVIGSNTFVGDGSKISKTCIGRNCKIGRNVSIIDSYIWDNVVIEDNAVITKSIVANDAVIKKGAKLEAGSVVSFNVVVGENRVLAKDVKVTTRQRVREYSDDESSDEDEEDQAEIDVSTISEDGKGHLYHDSDDSDYYESEDDEEYNRSLKSMIYSVESFSLSDTSIHSIINTHKKTHRRYSSNSGVSEGDDDEENFRTEAVESVTRSITENHDPDIAALELNTLRMSMNVGYHEVRSATIAAFITFISKMVTTGTLKVKEATENMFIKWIPLLKRQVFETDDEADLIYCIQVECSKRPHGEFILAYALNALYDEDMVSEEAVDQWWENPETHSSDKLKDVLKYAEKVVDNIQNAEEETDSESEEESD